MSEVKWIKIVTDIFDDEKILLIESIPDADSIIVIWFKLLCLAGRQNNGGVFLMNGRIAYTDEMFATIFRRPLNTVRLALATFEQYGMIEIINNTVTIPNWEKHQKLDALENVREQTRLRVARHREKQRMLAGGGSDCNVTDPVTVTERNADRLDKNRLDKIREDQLLLDDAAPVETVQSYATSNLQFMSPGNIQDMMSFMEDLPEDLIRFAIDEACSQGKPRWAYVAGILSGYLRNGIKTVGDAKEAKAAWDAKKKHTNQAVEDRDYGSGDDMEGFW